MSAPFRWTTNRALAASALALGLLATAGKPMRGHTVTLDTQELATIVESKVDHVSATELADWIVAGKADYRLVDLRDEAAFTAYHIPDAENVPLTQLPDYGLGRNEKIVLYSDGGIHSAQAWLLLRAQKYTGVYMLFGGLDAWKDEVLFPSAPADSTPEALAAFEKSAALARHFGGQPRAAAAASGGEPALVVTPQAPQANAAPSPAAPAGGAKKPAGGKKKAKEGC